VVDGFTFTKASNSSNTGNGINFSNWDGTNVVASNGATIQNAIIEAYGAHGGFVGSGFVSLGSGGATLENSKVASGAGYAALLDNRGVAAVEVKGSGNHTIRGNQLLVSTNNADAVNIYGGTVTVDNNTISGVDGGIVAYGLDQTSGFDGVTITNNTLSGYNDNGIRVFNYTKSADTTIEISGNTVTGANALLVDTNSKLRYRIGGTDAATLTTTTQLRNLMNANTVSDLQAAYYANWSTQNFAMDGLVVTGVRMGASGNDVLAYSGGNNILIGDTGDDTLTGGSGSDVVKFAGNYAAYVLAFSGSNVTVAGPDGNDTLTNVETLQFADKRVIVVGSAVGSTNTAVTQGVTTADAGDVVMVAAGTYSGALTVNKDITIRGANVGVAATAAQRGSGESIIQGKVTISSATTMDGFTLTKPSTSTNTGSNINFSGWDGVNVTLSNGAALYNTVVEAYGAHGGFGGSGFVSLGTGGATLENSKVLAGTGYTALADNRGVAAVEVKGSGNYTIRGNQLLVSTNNADAVNIYGGTVTVDNNTMSGVDGGIVAYGLTPTSGFDGVTITNNTLSGYNDNGIRVFNYTKSVETTVEISGNTITGTNALLVDANPNLRYRIGGTDASITTMAQLYGLMSGNTVGQLQAAYFVNWAPQEFTLDGQAQTGVQIGANGNDALSFSSGKNILIGGAGDDTLTVGTGTNVLEGGSGYNVAIFSGVATDYTITYNPTSITVVSKNGSPPISTNTLTNINSLQFAGQSGVVLVVPNGRYSTIQATINAASAGDTIRVMPGTYAENVVVNKSLTIEGSGKGADATTNTIVAPASGNGITVSANNVTVRGMQVVGVNKLAGNNGVYVDSTISNLALRDLMVTGQSYAIEIHNAAVINGLTIADTQVVSNTTGLRTATSGAASNIVISGSAFDYNDYGWNLAATSARTNNQNDFAGVTVSDTTFNYNKFKGLYAEKLHNATFTNVTANGSGYGATSPNGINLNLKYGTFANITFNGLTVTNSGNGANNGAGVAITPRNDSPSYSAKPASLSGLSLNNVTITGSPTTPSNIYYDLVLGNNLADSVSMNGVELQGTGIGLLVYGSAQGNPASFNLGNTRFASSLAGYVINAAGTATVTGTSAQYGSIAGGSSVTVDDGFAIADKIIDRTDTSLYGNVIVRSGNVYMTPNSYLAPATQANVQTAVSAADAGNTVWVKTGSYAAGTATANVNNLTIDVASGVTGFSGVILAESVTNGAITVTGASALDVTGNAGNNVLTGNSQTNTLTGGAGNDTLVGLAGTNSYNGGSGIDQIVYGSNAVSYTLAFSGSTVTVNGPDGSDTLAGVETLQFADKRAVIVGNAVASEYTTVAQGITAAASGDIVMVAAGTYSELITINKPLTLLGAQAGVKATGTTRNGGETVLDGTGNSSSYNVTVQANNVTIDGFKVDIRNLARDGINVRVATEAKPGDATIGAYRANITIRNNWISQNNTARTNQSNGLVFGEHVSNTAQAVNGEIANVQIRGNYIDMVTTSSVAIQGGNTSITGARGMVFTNMFRNSGASLMYTGLVVDDNTVFATYNTIIQAQLQTRMVGATFTNNVIGNSRSGVNLPSLYTGSVFSGNTIQDINPGADMYSNQAGAVIGMVDGTISNNTFRRIGGIGGLVLNGGRSADATYFPATRNTVVENNTFTYNDVTLAPGLQYTAGLNVQPNNDATTGAIAGTTGVDADSITVRGNTFTNAGNSSAIQAVAVVQRSVGKTLNLYNSSANTINGMAIAESLGTTEQFTLADAVADVTDAANLGAVSRPAGNVYVTPNSVWAASSTTTASIQLAMNRAVTNDMVWVQSGTYMTDTVSVNVNNVTLNVASGVTGFANVALNAPAVIFTLDGGNAVNVTSSAVSSTITGNGANNIITSGDGDDTLAGGAGNDTIAAGAGTNTINGGAGLDTAIFAGNATNYTITYGATSISVVSIPGFAPASSNTLSNVENLKFVDQTDKIVVGPNSEYTTIQSAINAADAGDTIQVMPGTYVENLTISKQLTIVGSGNGTNSTVDTIVTSATANTPVVTLSAGGVS
ncbi:MAG: hypothetical protein ACK46D_14045, partial [Roseiflexaceae bacterium]